MRSGHDRRFGIVEPTGYIAAQPVAVKRDHYTHRLPFAGHRPRQTPPVEALRVEFAGQTILAHTLRVASGRRCARFRRHLQNLTHLHHILSGKYSSRKQRGESLSSPEAPC